MLHVFRPPLAACCLALFCTTPALSTEGPSDAPPAKEAEPEPVVERAPLIERSQTEASGLERRLPPKEQQLLQAGEERFLSLWLPANAEEPKGLLILLPGDGETADWPQAIGPLRRALPDTGWSTLSLTLPDPSGDPPPPRPQKTEPPSQAEPAMSPEKAEKDGPANTEQAGSVEPNTDPAPPPLSRDALQKTQRERVFSRIEAALAFARQHKPTAIVLLGHGTGAYWATQFLSAKEPKDVRNLLLVSAELPSGYTPALEDSLSALKQVIGDVYYENHAADREAARQRLNASRRSKHPSYVQIALQDLPGDRVTQQTQLTRRIRGWLEQHAQANGDKPASTTQSAQRKP